MIRILDMFALAGMGAGIALIMQPWWDAGFRCGFFVALAFTILHIVTSHLSQPESS